ncbi:DNA translocase FtsK [Brevibacillus humidisoli]|uniref:FtsK/SpoIIIE family DNA translocase n=1 Tax=Brevibacillus humidisoli TaxID=2895522 RepID=UPI001E2F2F6B|nr:DNA translocase FtsK [Brevibacillus humidisoli]UFJ42189.1 DNA translocase FtsK [Brevibacillus humidisoli]
MSRRKKSSKRSWASVVKTELMGLLVIALALIGLLESGWLGKQVLAFLFRFIAGSWDFAIPLLMIGVALHMMFTRRPPKLTPRIAGFLLLLLSILIWDHMLLYQMITAEGRFEQSIVRVTWDRLWAEQGQEVSTTSVAGGMLGALLFAISYQLVGGVGTGLLIGLFGLIGIMLVFNLSYVDVLVFVKNKVRGGYDKLKQSVKESVQLLHDESQKEKEGEETPAAEEAAALEQPPVAAIGPYSDESGSAEGEISPPVQPEEEPSINPVIRDFAERLIEEGEEMPAAAILSKEQQARSGASGKATRISAQSEHQDAGFSLSQQMDEQILPYEIPGLKMLSRPKAHPLGKDVDHTTNAAKLVNTLKSFGVNAIVSEVHRGPAVTRYEVQPATGVKVSRIVSLTDDLALALAAKDIRIEAPIPGKSAIGIEVPNTEVAVVTLREVLESSRYQDASAKLTVALGRDISGEPIVADLAKMPHLLVAGATGSGKSVCINGLIMSILFKAKPHEVKLMMIDPKMVELNVYNGIPHLLAPVVTDPRRASVALKKVVAEMERRYNLFAQNGSRNIEMYNQIVRDQAGGDDKQAPLPYIVVIVDELADLMMVAPGEVEDAICRLAQMARAAGIHLIIATQRPSVDVITGVIKANIPSRIAFGVSSMADSRTILDMGGAEKLLGRGDMLFLPMGASKPIRVQGAFVSDKEVEEVVRFVKEQQEARYQEEMIPEEASDEPQTVIDDELYDQAVQIVVEAQTASASLLQRRLRIGYTRAARLIDMMESQGVVGPYEGSKPREVKVPRPSQESNIS